MPLAGGQDGSLYDPIPTRGGQIMLTTLVTLILADQLTLFQPGGTNYAHLITTGTPGCSDPPTALLCIMRNA